MILALQNDKTTFEKKVAELETIYPYAVGAFLSLHNGSFTVNWKAFGTEAMTPWSGPTPE